MPQIQGVLIFEMLARRRHHRCACLRRFPVDWNHL